MFVEHNTDLRTIVTYMLYSVPQMIYWVLPFTVCLGIITTQASFSRHVETIAMQASSVPVYRIYLPYIMVGVVATVFMIFLSFYLYPVAQKNADTIEDVYIRNRDVKGSFSVTGGRFKVGDSIYIVKHLDIQAGIMHNVICYQMRSGKLHRIVKAEQARWNGVYWFAQDMQVIELQDNGISIDNNSEVLQLRKAPEELVMAQPRPDVLTLDELRIYLQELQNDGIRSRSIETVFHGRISFAFAPFIMTLLVLPFGMRFPRTGGIARGIALGLMLGLIYWALHSAMTNIGSSGTISPVIASWLANTVSLCAGASFIYLKRGTYG